MKINYRDTDDVLTVQISDAPVVKDVSYGRNVSVGYDADGQLAGMTLRDLSSVLSRKPEEDETALLLTERESRRLLELIESPPPRSEHWLAALANHREHLRANEPALGADACAWMVHQAELLRSGALNDVQREILAAFFEAQVAATRREFEALLRRRLIDLQRLEHDPGDVNVAEPLADFRVRISHAIEASPSLREISVACLDRLWHEARMALSHEASVKDRATEWPEICPYTLEQAVGDFVPATPPERLGVEGDAENLVSTHITPVGGNIFLDLGFPPEEAARLKEESDRRISAKKGE